MKTKAQIRIILLLISSLLSGFVFMADYWEPFQGDLQDYMFYLTFVVPGILFSIALAELLNEKNVPLRSRIIFIALNSLLWLVLYSVCLQGYILSDFSYLELQSSILLSALIGALVIGWSSKTFLKTEEIPFYYLAGIGIAVAAIVQFALAPFITMFFQFNDSQTSGILVFFWQLGIGLYLWNSQSGSKAAVVS